MSMTPGPQIQEGMANVGNEADLAALVLLHVRVPLRFELGGGHGKECRRQRLPLFMVSECR